MEDEDQGLGGCEGRGEGTYYSSNMSFPSTFPTNINLQTAIHYKIDDVLFEFELLLVSYKSDTDSSNIIHKII